MSDMRFIIVSVLLIFAGFVILGGFGHNFQSANIESKEFGECYEYHTDREPVRVNCENKILDQSLFFIFIIALIAGGIVFLFKGIRGKWDNEVKPEDMVGPGGDKKQGKDDDKL